MHVTLGFREDERSLENFRSFISLYGKHNFLYDAKKIRS